MSERVVVAGRQAVARWAVGGCLRDGRAEEAEVVGVVVHAVVVVAAAIGGKVDL